MLFSEIIAVFVSESYGTYCVGKTRKPYILAGGVCSCPRVEWAEDRSSTVEYLG